MAKSYKDFESKKTIHFNITRESHSRLRIECFQKRVSMQEVFEEVAQRIAEQTPDMMNLLDAVSERKREKTIKKLSESDAESLYNIIEQENPISGDS
jgi:Tfp pilus assembly ATPase PilU